MANKFEVIYINKQSLKQERCTSEQWEKIKSHPTLGRAFALVKKEIVPQAAQEAEEAKAEEAVKPSSSKPRKRSKK